MVGKAGLKAGLIGAAVMVMITLINQFLLLEVVAGNIALTLVSCLKPYIRAVDEAAARDASPAGSGA